MKLIASTLTIKEKNFPSQSITTFFDRFKEVAYQKRNESCQRKDDDRIYQEILNKGKATSPIKQPFNDGRPRGSDSNRPWGSPNPNPKFGMPVADETKDQSNVIPSKEEPDPKRLKPNDNVQQQQTLNKFFKPTKEAVGTVNIGSETNTNRGGRSLCDGCGTVHPNPRTETDCNGCYFFRQKHPDFNYEKVSWKDSAIGKAYAKAGAEGLKGSKILREGNSLIAPNN